MTTFTFVGFKWEVDWDGDGTYGHTLSDITEYVNECSYRTGFTEAFVEVAPPARMVIMLENATGAWSVTKSTATFHTVFRKGLLVRLSWIYHPSSLGVDVDLPHFIGTITKIEITAGERGDQLAILTVEDPMLQLLDTEYVPPLLLNNRTDQVLERIFDDAALRYPYPHSYWMVGITGAAELDSTTILYDHDLTSFEQGQTVLEYAGDNADGGAGVSVQGYIRDIVASEAGGKFFYNPASGKFVFWNRHHISLINPATIFVAAVSWLLNPPPVYLYADDLMNSLDIHYEVKKLGTAGSIIYTATNTPLSIQSNDNRKFNARYRDATVQNARVGAINPINPAPGVDYIANTASDGSGTDVTAFVGVSCEFGANSANVTIFNQSGATAYITTFQLRGQPITTFARQTASSLDGDSIFLYGEHRNTFTIPFISDPQFAQDYANTKVQQFKAPYGRFARVSRRFSSDPPASDAVPGSVEAFFMGIGSAIETQVDTFLEDSYRNHIVIGEEGHITGRNQWIRTFVLEPIDRNQVWVLDTSTLDETTILAL